MTKTISALMLGLGLLATSCSKSVPQQMAEKMCSCQAVKDAIAFDKEMQTAAEPNSEENTKKMFAILNNINQCGGELTSALKDKSEEEAKKMQAEMKAAMEKKCPDIYKEFDTAMKRR